MKKLEHTSGDVFLNKKLSTQKSMPFKVWTIKEVDSENYNTEYAVRMCPRNFS